MHPHTTADRDAQNAPLLLVPGLLCDRAVFADVERHLAPDVDCRVCETATLPDLGAIAEHIVATAPPRFALAGHSMGARVALEIVRRAPERVLRLALLDTGWRARPEGPAGEDERAARHALLALAREQGMRAMGKVWVRRMVHPSRLADARLIDAILDMIERATPDRFAAQIAALLARPDAASVLRAIRCPVQILCGRDDAWSPLAQHEEIAAMIGGARLTAIDDCGHMAPMERPLAVADTLRGWLNTPEQRDGKELRWAS